MTEVFTRYTNNTIVKGGFWSTAEEGLDDDDATPSSVACASDVTGLGLYGLRLDWLVDTSITFEGYQVVNGKNCTWWRLKYGSCYDLWVSSTLCARSHCCGCRGCRGRCSLVFWGFLFHHVPPPLQLANHSCRCGRLWRRWAPTPSVPPTLHSVSTTIRFSRWTPPFGGPHLFSCRRQCARRCPSRRRRSPTTTTTTTRRRGWCLGCASVARRCWERPRWHCTFPAKTAPLKSRPQSTTPCWTCCSDATASLFCACRCCSLHFQCTCTYVCRHKHQLCIALPAPETKQRQTHTHTHTNGPATITARGPFARCG